MWLLIPQWNHASIMLPPRSGDSAVSSYIPEHSDSCGQAWLSSQAQCLYVHHRILGHSEEDFRQKLKMEVGLSHNVESATKYFRRCQCVDVEPTVR